MTLLFELIIITSILVLGYTIATQEGMVFYKIRDWAEIKKEQGHKWAEPLFLCHWCQPSSWALIAFAFAFGMGIIEKLEWNLILYYVLTVGGSSLLNGMIWGYHLKSNAEKELSESAKEMCEIVSDYIEDLYIQEDNREYEIQHYNN